KENSASLIKEYDIVVKSNGRLFNFDKEDFEYNFEYKKALKQAKLYSLKEQGKIKKTKYADMADEISDNSAFTLNYQVNNQSIDKAVKEVAEGTDKEPQNAKVAKFKPFADNRFEYKDGKDGYKLDRSDLQYELVEFFDKGAVRKTIDARVESITPEITLEDVKKNIVGLSTATSISSNTADGTHNMKVALEACNGSVINPGEVWSFNDCTGDSNLESNGYRNAAVINNKKIEQGVGGGICQASTTIFKCALFANMAVVERHNHYWASTYAYAGEDATIDYPNLDLRLKNTTDYQMFMECKVEGNTLIVNIYGYQDPSYDNIMLESENYDIRKGESYRTVTKRYLYLEGEIVKEETICNSTYSLKDNHIVRVDDEGSFRTTVNGQIKYETKPTEPTVATTEPETTQPETEKPTTKPTEKPTEQEPSETETVVSGEFA
ncbi:MAG: VanW family protein, partial [Ruminococcus sp.]